MENQKQILERYLKNRKEFGEYFDYSYHSICQMCSSVEMSIPKYKKREIGSWYSPSKQEKMKREYVLATILKNE